MFDVLKVMNTVNLIGAEFFPTPVMVTTKEGGTMTLGEAVKQDRRDVVELLAVGEVAVRLDRPAPEERERIRAAVAAKAARSESGGISVCVNDRPKARQSAPEPTPAPKPSVIARATFEGTVVETTRTLYCNEEDVDREVDVEVADVDHALLSYLEGCMGDTVRVTVEVLKRGDQEC